MCVCDFLFVRCFQGISRVAPHSNISRYIKRVYIYLYISPYISVYILSSISAYFTARIAPPTRCKLVLEAALIVAHFSARGPSQAGVSRSFSARKRAVRAACITVIKLNLCHTHTQESVTWGRHEQSRAACIDLRANCAAKRSPILSHIVSYICIYRMLHITSG